RVIPRRYLFNSTGTRADVPFTIVAARPWRFSDLREVLGIVLSYIYSSLGRPHCPLKLVASTTSFSIPTYIQRLKDSCDSGSTLPSRLTESGGYAHVSGIGSQQKKLLPCGLALMWPNGSKLYDNQVLHWARRDCRPASTAIQSTRRTRRLCRMPRRCPARRTKRFAMIQSGCGGPACGSVWSSARLDCNKADALQSLPTLSVLASAAAEPTGLCLACWPPPARTLCSPLPELSTEDAQCGHLAYSRIYNLYTIPPPTPYFFRTIPSLDAYAEVVTQFLKRHNWPTWRCCPARKLFLRSGTSFCANTGAMQDNNNTDGCTETNLREVADGHLIVRQGAQGADEARHRGCQAITKLSEEDQPSAVYNLNSRERGREFKAALETTTFASDNSLLMIDSRHDIGRGAINAKQFMKTQVLDGFVWQRLPNGRVEVKPTRFKPTATVRYATENELFIQLLREPYSCNRACSLGCLVFFIILLALMLLFFVLLRHYRQRDPFQLLRDQLVKYELDRSLVVLNRKMGAGVFWHCVRRRGQSGWPARVSGDKCPRGPSCVIKEAANRADSWYSEATQAEVLRLASAPSSTKMPLLLLQIATCTIFLAAGRQRDAKQAGAESVVQLLETEGSFPDQRAARECHPRLLGVWCTRGVSPATYILMEMWPAWRPGKGFPDGAAHPGLYPCRTAPEGLSPEALTRYAPGHRRAELEYLHSKKALCAQGIWHCGTALINEYFYQTGNSDNRAPNCAALKSCGLRARPAPLEGLLRTPRRQKMVASFRCDASGGPGSHPVLLSSRAQRRLGLRCCAVRAGHLRKYRFEEAEPPAVHAQRQPRARLCVSALPSRPPPVLHAIAAPACLAVRSRSSAQPCRVAGGCLRRESRVRSRPCLRRGRHPMQPPERAATEPAAGDPLQNCRSASPVGRRVHCLSSALRVWSSLSGQLRASSIGMSVMKFVILQTPSPLVAPRCPLNSGGRLVRGSQAESATRLKKRASLRPDCAHDRRRRSQPAGSRLKPDGRAQAPRSPHRQAPAEGGGGRDSPDFDPKAFVQEAVAEIQLATDNYRHTAAWRAPSTA
uniref:Guanylate cyclase n=1 Tax=Macrostomum lignano TaxID=282301 RepID=A0A1I8JQQ8_9PLAT